MKRRTIGLGLVTGLMVVASGLVAGCSSDGHPEEHGTLNLPLSTQGPSGATYRLRNATFEIRNEYDYYEDQGAGGEGGSGGPHVINVSSETDPNAGAISVSLERGYYYVRLLPGWHMEKVEGGSATNVEAQLLSSAQQWVYVAAHSTRWIEYQFGLGDRALWFNGNLNVEIQVYEKPSDLYGGAGESGVSGAPGAAGNPG